MTDLQSGFIQSRGTLVVCAVSLVGQVRVGWGSKGYPNANFTAGCSQVHSVRCSQPDGTGDGRGREGGESRARETWWCVQGGFNKRERAAQFLACKLCIVGCCQVNAFVMGGASPLCLCARVCLPPLVPPPPFSGALRRQRSSTAASRCTPTTDKTGARGTSGRVGGWVG